MLIFLLAGYQFGKIAWIQRNFALVTVGIVMISLLPIGWELLRVRFAPAGAAALETIANKPVEFFLT